MAEEAADRMVEAPTAGGPDGKTRAAPAAEPHAPVHRAASPQAVSGAERDNPGHHGAPVPAGGPPSWTGAPQRESGGPVGAAGPPAGMPEQAGRETSQRIPEKNPAGETFDILRDTDPLAIRDALKDLVMLAGVLKDLASERFWHEPRCVYDTLRTFDLVLRSTFYEEEAVQGEQELIYRFEKEYGAAPSIDIPRLVRLGRRYNWLTGPQQVPLKFTVTGRRMVTQFFRLANDALAYHGHALKELYQAERDLQLARAYEDVGVGRHDTIASVLNNLENALTDLRYQREKYIQDRRVLEKYQAVISLLEMLERELEARFARLEGIVDRRLERQHRRGAVLFYRLVQELSALLGENAYLSQVQIGRKILRIDRAKFLQYLLDVYEGNLPANGLTPLQILKYMEDGVYDQEEDGVSGLWLPFTLPPMLHEEDVQRGVAQLNDWIEHWAPPAEDGLPELPPCRPARRVTAGELSELLGAATSIAAELATDTRPLVEAVRENPGVSMAGLLRLLGGGWPETVRNLFVLGYLVTAGEVRLFTHLHVRERDSAGARDGQFDAVPDLFARLREREENAAGRTDGEKPAATMERTPDRSVRGEKGAAGGPEGEEAVLPDGAAVDGAGWRLGYPDGVVRYVKGTPSLGRHLEKHRPGEKPAGRGGAA